jgi:hypothetical protein
MKPSTVCASSDGAQVHTLQIAWHPSHLDDPKLSHNLSPTDAGRFATAGADNMARVWCVGFPL